VWIANDIVMILVNDVFGVISFGKPRVMHVDRQILLRYQSSNDIIMGAKQ
jgi:uncharacterized protein YbaP (TraB family)